MPDTPTSPITGRLSLHTPEGDEIDVEGYERQPVTLVPHPDTDLEHTLEEADGPLVENESLIEFSTENYSGDIGAIGLWLEGDSEPSQLVDLMDPPTIAHSPVRVMAGHIVFEAPKTYA